MLLLVIIGLAVLMLCLIKERVWIWSRFIDKWFSEEESTGQGVISISPEIPPPRKMRGKPWYEHVSDMNPNKMR